MSDLVYNPYAWDLHEDPYDTYRRLRDEEPAYWNPELRFWVLSRFDDVLEGFRDYETFISSQGIALESRGGGAAGTAMMIEVDPPDHTALRKTVNRVFTVRRIAEMEQATREIVSAYIDEFAGRGEADLVAELTGPFPMDVISAVLGVPEADRDVLRVFADKLLIREDGKMRIPDEALEGMFELLAYFQDDMSRRRDGQGTGLFTELAQIDLDGRPLTDEELLGFCVLFVIAGHETTTKMVANAVELLSRHPEQRDMVVADAGLIPGAVEEVLRFHNSTQYMHRTCVVAHEIHGQTMRPGDSVLLLIGAANHDEREFGPTAEAFDITRRPERNLAFGYGAHYCLGASLARMEGRVALEEIYRRLPDIEVDHDAKVRFHSGNVTGWTSLPVRFSATS
ncbi:MAG: cytochrome P450 [Actinomycetes bacterium]